LPASLVEWIIITRPLLILFWFWACFYFVWSVPKNKKEPKRTIHFYVL
jgi:hypothetical protein